MIKVGELAGLLIRPNPLAKSCNFLQYQGPRLVRKTVSLSNVVTLKVLLLGWTFRGPGRGKRGYLWSCS